MPPDRSFTEVAAMVRVQLARASHIYAPSLIYFPFQTQVVAGSMVSLAIAAVVAAAVEATSDSCTFHMRGSGGSPNDP